MKKTFNVGDKIKFKRKSDKESFDLPISEPYEIVNVTKYGGLTFRGVEEQRCWVPDWFELVEKAPMEAKFKSGQRVKVTQELYSHLPPFIIKEGDCFTVDRVCPFYYALDHVGLTLKELEGFFHERYFELIEDMKEEFFVGEKVFVANGDKFYEGVILDNKYMVQDELFILVKYQSVAGRDQTSVCHRDGVCQLDNNWRISKEPPFDWAALWAAIPNWHDMIYCNNAGWFCEKKGQSSGDWLRIPVEIAPPFSIKKEYTRP